MLTALAAALLPALFLAPHLLAARGAQDGFADRHTLAGTVRDVFVEYWGSGDRAYPPDLDGVVGYWFRFHVAKAVIATLLLCVLAALGLLLWRAYLGAGGRGRARRTGLASAGVLVTLLALASLVTAMANVQGAVAPFTSLLTMLPVGASHGPLADTLAEVRQRLADSSAGGGPVPPALAVMIDDNARYHLTMAVTAAVVALALAAGGAVLWRRRAGTVRSDGRTRRVLASFGVLSALLSLAVLVVAVANTTVAADSAQGLSAFFRGG